MINEIGAGIGGAGVLGCAIAMFKFFNAKIDKKQDTTMCKTISTNIKEDLIKGEDKFEAIMNTLTAIQVATGKIESELKHFNGKT